MWLLILLAFDPAATQATLTGGGDRRAVLAAYEDLRPGEIEAARAAGHAEVVARIVTDPAAPLAERIWAVRALGRLGGTPALTALAPLVAVADAPEASALAREAARALAHLDVTLLAGALESTDPEVREIAAQSGAGAGGLCALLADPWPTVRVAAARGLQAHPTHAGCLAGALADPDRRVQAAAARSATLVKLPALRTPLRSLAGGTQAPLDARAEAFMALAALGDFEPAERALAAHLGGGGSEPLAEAAIRALTLRGTPDDRTHLRAALDSASPAVRAAAGRALTELQDTDATPRIRARTEDTPGLRGLSPVEERDPADSDPE